MENKQTDNQLSGLSESALSALKAMGGVVPGLQESLIKQLNQTQSKQEKQPEVKQEAKQEPLKQEVVQSKAETKKEVETEEEDNSFTIDNPLAKNIKFGKSKESKPEYKTFDDYSEAISKEFGINGKDPKEIIAKYNESTKKWRADAQRVNELAEKVEQYGKFYDSLPEEIAESINLAASGGDYTEPFRKSSVDLKKNFKDLDVKKIVDHYFPGEFTPDDFEDSDSKAVKLAVKAAEERFKADKQSYEAKRAAIYAEAQMKNDLMQKSVVSSVENLRKSFPGLDESDVNVIQKKLAGGEINKYLYNKDGSYSDKAALMLAMADNSLVLDYIDKLQKAAVNKGKSQSAEEVLTRGADVPSYKKKGADPKSSNAALQDQLNAMMQRMVPKKTF